MNAIALSFLFFNAAALLLLPRRWAPMPLLVGACYMTLGQGFELGPLTFTVIRILVAVGVVRVIVRGERVAGGLNGLDWLMVAWGAWAVASSAFHEQGALVNRLGMVYDSCGIYFLVRVFCSSIDDVVLLCRITALLLVPVAIEMIYENLASHNLFAVLGGVPGVPEIREGRIRANGPFAHPILAGTVGAVNLPLMIGIWRYYWKTACLGILACLTMVVCSASSGPVMSALFALGALFMWFSRRWMRLIRWVAVCMYIALDLAMKAPAYYLMARIDVAGGSTGWHRARLIESAFEHFSEWWFAGTDYTRHWIAYGVGWSPNHTDITNYYLSMGVLGGLPLMLLLIAVMTKAFSFVGGRLGDPDLSPQQGFVVWALGSALFAHAATSMSVTYFDQSFVFFYLIPATIASVRFAKISAPVPVVEFCREPNPAAASRATTGHARVDTLRRRTPARRCARERC